MTLNAERKLTSLRADHNVLGSTVSVGDELVAGLVSPVMLRAHALA